MSLFIYLFVLFAPRHFSPLPKNQNFQIPVWSGICRVQRKLFLQLAIRASWSLHFLAQTSFQLAPKAFWREELTSQFICYSNSSKNITCPSGKLKTEFTSPIAKSTSPGLSDTTFLHACYGQSWRSRGSVLQGWVGQNPGNKVGIWFEEPLFGGDKIKIINPLSIQRNLRLCITQEI